MGKINFKSILINGLLIFLILLVLGYNLYYFLIAPNRTAQNQEISVIERIDID